MNELVRSLRAAADGRTHIFSVGQAGYIIKSAKGQLLGVDLYLSDCVERIEGHVGFKRLLPKILSPKDIEFDGIITTHFHGDHFDVDSVGDLMLNTKTLLYAPKDCQEMIQQLGVPTNRVHYIRPSDVCTLGDFTLCFINCDHGLGAPDAVGVIVEVDGKRILEVGDTCLRIDRKDEYLSRGKLDVLIAPINGAYGNLNEVECATLADTLKPQLTIPCHYGMFASHGGNVGMFFDIMRERYPHNKFLLMAQGEEYEL